MVPELVLGSFRIVPLIGASTPRDPTAQGAPIIRLGTWAFLPTVVTIDYPKKELVLRSGDYDLAKAPLGPKEELCCGSGRRLTVTRWVDRPWRGNSKDTRR